jgi:hypothetical protein
MTQQPAKQLQYAPSAYSCTPHALLSRLPPGRLLCTKKKLRTVTALRLQTITHPGPCVDYSDWSSTRTSSAQLRVDRSSDSTIPLERCRSRQGGCDCFVILSDHLSITRRPPFCHREGSEQSCNLDLHPSAARVAPSSGSSHDPAASSPSVTILSDHQSPDTVILTVKTAILLKP